MKPGVVHGSFEEKFKRFGPRVLFSPSNGRHACLVGPGRQNDHLASSGDS